MVFREQLTEMCGTLRADGCLFLPQDACVGEVLVDLVVEVLRGRSQ